MHIERLDFPEWDDALPTTGLEPFHATAALETIERHVDGELHLLGGFKGDQPVGLLPVHERHKFGGRILTSPPLSLGIGRLGPLIMSASPKQRKQEQTNRRFIEQALSELDSSGPRTLVRFACAPSYTDPRPFQWDDFDVTPAFTYRISLADTDADTVLNSFTRDLRKEIRKREEVPLTIERGGVSELQQVHQSLEDRFEEQGQRHPLSWPFVRDLYESLGDRARVYTARDDGEFVAGTVVLYSNESAYFWKGGAKTDYTVSPGSLIHWEILTDILEEEALSDIEAYDLYTANNRRLTDYKSKFGGTPQPYFIVESNGPAMTAAKGVYRMAAFGKNPLGESGQI